METTLPTTPLQSSTRRLLNRAKVRSPRLRELSDELRRRLDDAGLPNPHGVADLVEEIALHLAVIYHRDEGL